ncbi:helix-turn-helix transcriptional regulator [Sphingobium sp. WCS2017Hpa-17]|uniref:helix-turn-helix domain-containing protein n=1 Tax=Sphingobium sp. WCS2017Hpa-17 TaxID=3073638 RepID=UPI00288A4DDB|nr:helix-turn-helix transcriptional regulator [Sphingobium sp. WCS2017Hpa-17]
MSLKSHIEQRGRASDLAKKAGVSLSTVTRIASGERNPTKRMIERIIAASNGELEYSDFFAPVEAG